MELDYTFILPCLNEEKTLEHCIKEIQKCIKDKDLNAEILVSDNNSTDNSVKIAKENGLEVSDKPDSQDFYEGDYNELLGIGDKTGNIVDVDGNVLAQHNGIWNYTVGQRKGIGVSSTEPLYVLELRKDTNEVVVGFKDKTFKNLT